MIRWMPLLVATLLIAPASAEEVSGAKEVQTPYGEQHVVFDFYFDRPEKAAQGLYWIRSLMNPLLGAPYDLAPEMLEIKVVVHGTEIVTLARKNYAKYKDIVERMRYYASLGVEFRVCALAAQHYGYTPQDFYDFVQIVPSGITELAHWQLQGYALIQPTVMEKVHSTDQIR